MQMTRRRFGRMAPPKTALASERMFNVTEGDVRRQETYRNHRLLATLPAGKICNAAKRGIRRQKLTEAAEKVGVWIPKNVTVAVI